ncbi:hypothetical protein D3C81_946030 [compost metagenome]
MVAIGGLFETDIAVFRFHLCLALAGIQRGTLIHRVLLDLDIDAIGGGDAAGNGLAAAAFAAFIAAFTFGIHGQIATGGGINAHAGTAAGFAVAFLPTVLRRFTLVAICRQRYAPLGGLVFCSAILQFAAGGYLNIPGGNGADYGLRTAAALFAAAAIGADIQPDIRCADAADLVNYTVGVQLRGFPYRALNRAGDGAVINVGTDIHADVGFAGVAAFAVDSGQMGDAVGIFLIFTAHLVLGTLLGQLVLGVNGQIAGNVAARSHSLAAFRVCFAVLVTAFDTGTDFIYATGVIKTAANFGFLGVAGGLVFRRQEGDVVAADAGITLSGRQFGAGESHVFIRFQRYAAATEHRRLLLAAGGFLAVAGMFNS